MIDAPNLVRHFFLKETYGPFIAFHKSEAPWSGESEKSLRRRVRNTIDRVVGSLLVEIQKVSFSGCKICSSIHERKFIQIHFDGLKNSATLAQLFTHFCHDILGDTSLGIVPILGGINVSWDPNDKKLYSLLGMPYAAIPDDDHQGEFLRSGRYSDVVFCVNERQVYGHKVILARHPFFAALFDASAGQMIYVSDIREDLFMTALKFIYTGTVSLAGQSVDHLTELAQVSNKMGLSDLKQMCHFHIQLSIDAGNVFCVAAYARRARDDKLLQACSCVKLSTKGPRELVEFFLNAQIYGMKALEEKAVKSIVASMNKVTHAFYSEQARLTKNERLAQVCQTCAHNSGF